MYARCIRSFIFAKDCINIMAWLGNTELNSLFTMFFNLNSFSDRKRNLFVIIFLLIFVIVDLEVSEFIRISGRCNNAKPVTEVVFLQILLCQILEVPLTERNG